MTRLEAHYYWDGVVGIRWIRVWSIEWTSSRQRRIARRRTAIQP